MFRLRRQLACQGAVTLVSDYLDGRLNARDAARLESHLAACPHCSEYLAQLRVSVDVLGRVSFDALSDEAVDDLVAVFRQWQAG
jgi:anti-sigma factor RsiW